MGILTEDMQRVVGEQRLGYVPTHTVAQGIGEALSWYVTSHGRTLAPAPSLRATSTFPAYSAPEPVARAV